MIFLMKVIAASKPNTEITICTQQTGEEVNVLNLIISQIEVIKIIEQDEFVYQFEDKASNHY